MDVFQYRDTDDHAGAVAELQDQYYPDAWMYARPITERPIASYTVVYSSTAERVLAEALKPRGVSAEYKQAQQ
jgi:hypothetical protein